MAKGKWKARMAELKKIHKNDMKTTKKFQDALGKMIGPAQDFARVAVKEGDTMKLGMNQMEIQLTGCIQAATSLAGLEVELETAEKAKDKKKVADIQKKMKPFEKAHDLTRKQGTTAKDKTEAAIVAISASMKTLQSAIA